MTRERLMAKVDKLARLANELCVDVKTLYGPGGRLAYTVSVNGEGLFEVYSGHAMADHQFTSHVPPCGMEVEE